MEDIRSLFIMIRQLAVILNKKQRFKAIRAFFVILIGSFFELLGVTAILPFIQALINPDDLKSNHFVGILMRTFEIKDNTALLFMIGAGIIIVYLIKNIYLAFSTYLQTAYSNNTQRELAVLMLEAYLKRPYSFFVERGSGEVLRGVSGDVSGVYNVLLNGFKLLAEITTIIMISVYLAVTDPVLATGVLAVGLVCMIIIVFGLKGMLSRMAIKYRDASYNHNKWILQIVNGIKDIMVFNKRDYFIRKYDEAYEELNIANTKSTFAGTLPERIIESFCISGILITVMIRIKLGINAAEYVPKMAVFAMGAFRLLPSISRSTGYISLFVYNRPMVNSTYENIISAREELKCIKERTKEENLISFENIFDIKDISWKYPSGKEYVLKHLSLSIRKGEVIGIIGESGSGKSTLADILLCLYNPQAGGIYLDGMNIHDIPNGWSQMVSYVPQSVFLIDDSIRANIAFGLDEYDDDLIWTCLEKSALEVFVKELPDGLNTLVGERGVKFSGGQRQRIAIARALYRSPKILILDEATAALDNETEEAVMDSINLLRGEMTLIIIAHRLTTLKECNRIVEIVDGIAIERQKRDILNS